MKNSDLKKKNPKKSYKSEESIKEIEGINEVRLVGRVSALPIEREMPSGDKVVEFRLVISRPLSKASSGSSKREVDTLDIAAWSFRCRRSALTLKPNMWIEVQGAVRRRFWQAPTGLASRWQVEAHRLTRI